MSSTGLPDDSGPRNDLVEDDSQRQLDTATVSSISPTHMTAGEPATLPVPQSGASSVNFAEPASDSTSPRNATASVEEDDSTFINFKVVAVDRAKKDTFKFEVTTNLKHFKRPNYVKQRTYAEFERLRAHLVVTYPQAITPPLPPQFSNALTAEENERRVKTSINRFLTRVGVHNALKKDDELRAFVESEFPFQPPNKVKFKSSVGSLRAKFSRIVPSGSNSGTSSPRSTGSSASQQSLVGGSLALDDEDVAFERMKKDGQHNEALGVACSKGLGNIVKARKGISFGYVDIAAKLSAMGGAEYNVSWANGLRKFCKCLQSMSELKLEQASSENAILGDIFDMQIRTAKAVQEAVSTRASLKLEQDNLVRATEKKRRDLEKMKGASAIRSDRVDDALEDLEESKRSALQGAANLARVSHSLRATEYDQIYATHQTDLLQALADHALRAAEHERAQLRLWESCIPDITKVISEPAVVGERVNARGVAERLAGAFL